MDKHFFSASLRKSFKSSYAELPSIMAPKKKGNKQANDDWEAELGETVDPIAAATQEAKELEASKAAEEDGDSVGGGGLLAALKKNKSKKQKKGKPVDEDYLQGEDPPSTNGHTEPDGISELASKAPAEADADDLFDTQVSKTKGGKGKQGKPEVGATEDGDLSGGEGGGLRSKKEKEKEKKEREKQRKKEQVFDHGPLLNILKLTSPPE